ncbi:type II secretion system protein GspM [Sphingosinicella soli]|uniref:General secretion pathway protein M n=1 Tax=Sphingosinicella soli TaxID=333708 RepID=A0A7W7B124_9SPHN|nr:type II secretion system protein GspM [Sphingosinicella soli]MBB4631919.1 general secretion pathway protein M [Sphingosinicella soli]
MQTALTWWQARDVREQRLLAVLELILLAMLVWLAILRPLAAFRESAADRHSRIAAQMPSVRAAAAGIAAEGAAPARGEGRDIREQIAASASAAGLEFSATQPEESGVLVSIAAVKPTFLFGWIAGLEADGVVADRVLVQRNDDSTVSAQIGFSDGPA